jgi:hypothetical protein
LAVLTGTHQHAVRAHRHALGVRPVYKRVDTCAAEFATTTAYMYSTYEEECESQPTDRRKIIVLGGGPNRIGQGIEFDYCCVHAAFALRDRGFETIMVNCNPETVSTDYDTSDRLYFEPLTLEDVLEIVEKEKAIFSAQAEASGKPANVIEKMVEGRVKKFLGEITLVGQPFVKDPDQTVAQLLANKGAKVARFVRLDVGEGIEKVESNFAEEVMAQVRAS